jgi:2-polyprenyl-3-methyl-5-hydroxy-6-metoxy-1,4-benzoquinol methylase
MSTQEAISDQHSSAPTGAYHTAEYLTLPVMAVCQKLSVKRILDVGCGNGAMCGALADAGFEMVGCEPDDEGIAFATKRYPAIRFHQIGIYDDPSTLGEKEFDAVVSTEVIEHLMHPKFLPRFASQVLRPGGHLIVSTPYHGYLKNLMLAITGKFDFHFTALWDGGHVKFWSRATLTRLLTDEGFEVIDFIGAGRLPYLWKSMILVARKL